MFYSHYRYVVLLACFMITFLSGGVGYGNASIYHIYWMESFRAENAQIAIIGSLSIGLCSMLGKLEITPVLLSVRPEHRAVCYLIVDKRMLM